MCRETARLLPLILLAACGGGGAANPPAAPSVEEPATPPPPAAAAPAAVPTREVAFDTAAAAGERPLLREKYSYQGSARDPFRPVVVLGDAGPELPNLRLIGILYDTRQPEKSVVMFRENGSNRRFSWHPGERFGRIYVASVTDNSVTLRMDDFGVTRSQTYTLRKTDGETP
jgi:hypothetical protein